MTDWDTDTYERFAAERRQPFDDLVAACTPVPDGLVYDLGCGTGNRTVDLPDALGARLVIGVDTSVTMLERAYALEEPRVRFEVGDLRSFDPGEPVDLVLSNAALHWVDDHAAVLARWRSHLTDGGQLAVQVPANFDHPTQAILGEVAADHPDWFGPEGPPGLISTNGESPERYAEILHTLGASNQRVWLAVYAHELPDTLAVVDWLRATTLRPYRKALDDEQFQRLLEEYSARLLDHYGTVSPFLYTFKRILFHATF